MLRGSQIQGSSAVAARSHGSSDAGAHDTGTASTNGSRRRVTRSQPGGVASWRASATSISRRRSDWTATCVSTSRTRTSTRGCACLEQLEDPRERVAEGGRHRADAELPGLTVGGLPDGGVGGRRGADQRPAGVQEHRSGGW